MIHWHDGWIPNRDDVEDIVDLVRGEISKEEYNRRADQAAERNRGLYKDAPRSGYEPYPPV